MNSSEWAAWVQAVGSIAAIIAAGRIASRQERVAAVLRDQDRSRDAERALIEARDHAIEIAPAMLAWDKYLDAWRLSITADEGVHRWVNLGRISDDSRALLIPEAVLRLSGNYRLLGKAAEAVQSAVVSRDLLKMYEGSIKALWTQKNMRGVDSVEANAIDPIFEMIECFCDAVSVAQKAVLRLRDAKL